ncbi:STAS domain-containing protein [Bhargavaea beijingensis]|uniref:Anti-sigma factor antagonist n=1 Tax=Bhargavaea beijingensis TaxID=426756 RepID=A0A1G7F6G8_9BACL|nr:STAS domain-containing protein [Bhargavaea beijingensis]MCW1927657.1 STAS domain-containing protein [Bhargavaea beijingensis]RSK33320.1 anti-sigma factor antagonist [Bhargavaea beijingensis]SDE71507.1 anti-sigma B factor antagonist [Bhargavaea beijingensis]
MNLQVDLREENSVQHFKVVGEIDAFTAPVLREKLSELTVQQGVKVEIDLSDVEYMDSTGLGVFVGYFKQVKESGGHVKITGLSPRLKRLFDITGLDEVMDIEGHQEDKGGFNDATV